MSLLFNLLHSDHKRLDDLFSAYQTSKKKDFDRAYQVFLDFRGALLRHFASEEEILFPAYDKIVDDPTDPTTAILKEEHQQMMEVLDRIYAKLQKHDIDSGPDEERLICLHHNHALEEDKIMYPVMDQLLTENERKAVVERMIDLAQNLKKDHS